MSKNNRIHAINSIAERLPEARRGHTTIVFTRSPAFTAVADEILSLPAGSAVPSVPKQEQP